MYKKILILLLALAISAASAFAQGNQTRSAVSGQKYKIKGVVVAKDDSNTFVVRDTVGVDTRVVIAPNASIKNKSFWGGDSYPVTALVRGLNLEIEGVGDSSGNVSVNKVRFDKGNLATAQSIDARVTPAEERLSAAEQNAERVSGQIDELMAISNAAKGGAKAAQDTADAAIAADRVGRTRGLSGLTAGRRSAVSHGQRCCAPTGRLRPDDRRQSQARWPRCAATPTATRQCGRAEQAAWELRWASGCLRCATQLRPDLGQRPDVDLAGGPAGGSS